MFGEDGTKRRKFLLLGRNSIISSLFPQSYLWIATQISVLMKKHQELFNFIGFFPLLNSLTFFFLVLDLFVLFRSSCVLFFPPNPLHIFTKPTNLWPFLLNVGFYFRSPTFYFVPQRGIGVLELIMHQHNGQNSQAASFSPCLCAIKQKPPQTTKPVHFVLEFSVRELLHERHRGIFPVADCRSVSFAVRIWCTLILKVIHCIPT